MEAASQIEGATGAEVDAGEDVYPHGHDHAPPHGHCCPYYHEAIELVGRRWTGAIIQVLMERPMRFSEVGQAVGELRHRLLSARMKELEARGIVERTVHPGPPVRVEYSLSRMGRELGPALSQLQVWAQRWLNDHTTA
jgi:DNA-binding HxlR family transcriptional regulator